MISHRTIRPSSARPPAPAHFNVGHCDEEISASSERPTLAGAASTTKRQEALKFFLVEDNAIIRENLAETLHEIVGAEVVGMSDSQNEATAWLCDPSHAWDVAGAMRAGCAAAFVARPGALWNPLLEKPDVWGRDLREVADQIIARDR